MTTALTMTAAVAHGLELPAKMRYEGRQAWRPNENDFVGRYVAGQTVELPGTHHYAFVSHEQDVLREVRRFLSAR